MNVPGPGTEEVIFDAGIPYPCGAAVVYRGRRDRAWEAGAFRPVGAMSAVAARRARQQSPAHVALGHAVRELRARRGLSQEELGFCSGLHRNYVGAIERGEINPTFRILIALARGLSEPLSELLVVFERQFVALPSRDGEEALTGG